MVHVSKGSRLDRLAALEKKSPLRKMRAWVLYQKVQRKDGSIAQRDLQAVTKSIGLTSAQTDRAIDDLVQHGLAVLSSHGGMIFLRLLENEPLLNEVEAGSHGGG